MPIDPTGTTGPATYKIIVVGPHDVEFPIEVYSVHAPTEGDADDVVQSFIDHMSTWPDLVSFDALNTYKMKRYQHAITPTP